MTATDYCLIHPRTFAGACSCERKAAQLRNKGVGDQAANMPASALIRDYLRMTLAVADPMVAAIIVDALFDIPSFILQHVKNKYYGNTDDILRTGSPSILINFAVALPDIPFAHVAEMQIHLDHFLSHKNFQHKTYEFVRALKANNLHSLLCPVYAPVWQTCHVNTERC